MYKKMTFKKGVNVVLVVSMIGLGSLVNSQNAHATGVANGNISVTQLAQLTSPITLSKLEIEGVGLDQPFKSNVNAYSATIENNVGSIKLIAETGSQSSIITVNDQPMAKDPYPVRTGENIFTILIDDGANIPNTYTLKVTRKQNNNNLLQDIQLSKGKLSPAFDPSITAYKAQIPNDVAELIVTPKAIKKTSKVFVNNTRVLGKGASIQIPIGKTVATVFVTAENGEKKTYTVEVTRDSKKTGTTATRPSRTNGNSISNGKPGSKRMGASGGQGFQLQNNVNLTKGTSTATLGKLTISKGIWNKSFASTKFTYHIAEVADVTEVTINPTPSLFGATISFAGDTGNVIRLGKNKKTIIPVVVTKGDEHKTYVLVFDKNSKQKAVTTDDTVEVAESSTIINSSDSINNPKAILFNGRDGNMTTSWWGRLIIKIRSFF